MGVEDGHTSGRREHSPPSVGGGRLSDPKNGGSPRGFLGHLEWLNVLHVELWLSSVVVLQSPEPTQVAFTSTNQVPIRGTYTAHTPTRPLGEGIVGDWLVGFGQRERALALIGKLEPGNVVVLSPVPLSPIARSNRPHSWPVRGGRGSGGTSRLAMHRDIGASRVTPDGGHECQSGGLWGGMECTAPRTLPTSPLAPYMFRRGRKVVF